MLSSLIFVALAAAWLVVLVPMFARRRQEVSHTTDAQLAARVIRRGGDRKDPRRRSNHGPQYADREVFVMPDTDNPTADRHGGGRAGFEQDFDDSGYDEADYEGWQGRSLNSDDARAARRYRPGRGGFDPEAAALAARTKYARRQRIVLTMLVAAVATAVLAALAVPRLWWVHGAVDLLLVGYLTYLRTQVRIEEDIRDRRLARLSGLDDDADDAEAEPGEYVDGYFEDRHYRPGDYGSDFDADFDEEYGPEFDGDFDEYGAEDYRAAEYRGGSYRPERGTSSNRSRPDVVASRDASVLDIDDEDPMFDELDERTWEPYRRAAGE